jgi:chromosome segregation ATPase
MTPFKKSLILVLLTALLSALTTYYFFEPTPQASITQAQQAIKTVKKQEQAIDKSYTLAFAKLQKENDSLKKLADFHKAALYVADEKVSVLESRVSQLANKVNTEPDTIKAKIPDCDSLSKATVALIKQEDKKDSLCSTTIEELTTEVSGKDSVINVCNESYRNIKLTLDTSIQQQQYLTDQLNILNKHIKRKTFESRFLSVTVILLSGIAGTLYLEHR